MAKKTSPLLPSTDELLRQLGDRLQLARRRRRLSAKRVAERAGMSPMTLRSLERGGSGVTMGAYLAVMQVLGVEKDLDQLAKADPLGRALQDTRLPAARTAHMRATPANPKTSRKSIQKLLQPPKIESDWIAKSGFVSSDALAKLISPRAHFPKKGR